MNSDTERLVLEILEFLVAREGVFLESQIVGGRQLLASSVNETNAPQIDALRGLMDDRDRARELLNSLRALKQQMPSEAGSSTPATGKRSGKRAAPPRRPARPPGRPAGNGTRPAEDDGSKPS